MPESIHINDYDPNAFAGFKGSQMVVSDRFVMFWKPPCPFSQWTRSPFKIDGISYVCAEQYMMAEKARLFGDLTIAKQILNTDNPRKQQQLGKRVSGFKNQQWVAERCKIVFDGNVAKFSQNSDLKDALLATENRTLVEASPFDKIWGIGFAANDRDAYHPERWIGLNLLGNILTDVRAHLD